MESMFYQVRVPEEDADMLRFLWWSGGNLNATYRGVQNDSALVLGHIIT